MILIASVIGGAATGYFRGAARRGTSLFLIIWFAVFAGQTALLLAASDDVRDPSTGAWDVSYFPIALAILVLGIAVLHGTAALRRQRSVNARADAVR